MPRAAATGGVVLHFDDVAGIERDARSAAFIGGVRGLLGDGRDDIQSIRELEVVESFGGDGELLAGVDACIGIDRRRGGIRIEAQSHGD